MSNNLTPTVVITTKDRPQLLAKAVESVLKQTTSCQLVVVDDGSMNKDTEKMVLDRFPQIEFKRNPSPLGIIKARNEAFGLSKGEIIFTLDDDAVFAQHDLVERVLKDFELPFIGVVTIPLIDHYPDGETRRRLPINEKRIDDFLCSHSFSGGANAMRASAFQAVGGYIGDGRQGEERGVALRMMEIGLFTKIAECCHIDHYPEAMPDNSKKVLFYNIRNSIVFGTLIIPFPDLILHVAGTLLTHLKSAFKQRAMMDYLNGVTAGIIASFRNLKFRKPVSSSVYGCYRRLAKLTPFTFSRLKHECEQSNVRMKEKI